MRTRSIARTIEDALRASLPSGSKRLARDPRDCRSGDVAAVSEQRAAFGSARLIQLDHDAVRVTHEDRL
jgi:hypothetical protein